MGKGRKALPDSRKVIQGTFRPGRVNPEAPKPADDGPRAPGGCSALEAEWFGRLVGRLEQEGRASASHAETIWLAAKEAAAVEECQAIISEHGRAYWKDGQGGRQLRSNPAVGQQNEAMRHLHGLLSELGLTPASLGKVSAKKQSEKENPFARFGRA